MEELLPGSSSPISLSAFTVLLLVLSLVLAAVHFATLALAAVRAAVREALSLLKPLRHSPPLKRHQMLLSRWTRPLWRVHGRAQTALRGKL